MRNILSPTSFVRYEKFMEEVLLIASIEAKINGSELCKKYGISPSFFTFLIRNGYASPMKEKQHYTFSILDLTTEQLKGILQEYQRARQIYNNSRRNKTPILREKTTGTWDIPVEKEIKEIITRLKQLNAHGKITIQKEFEF